MGEVVINQAALDEAVSKLVGPVLRKAGAEAVSIAKAAVPVGDTGELRDSIHATEDGRDVIVHADAPYAMHIEFGTRHAKKEPFFIGSVYAAMRRAGK